MQGLPWAKERERERERGSGEVGRALCLRSGASKQARDRERERESGGERVVTMDAAST